MQGSGPLGRLIYINAVLPARVVPPARGRNLLGAALCALFAVGVVTATGEATPDPAPGRDSARRQRVTEERGGVLVADLPHLAVRHAREVRP